MQFWSEISKIEFWSQISKIHFGFLSQKSTYSLEFEKIEYYFTYIIDFADFIGDIRWSFFGFWYFRIKKNYIFPIQA